jgi:hypothetical protein
LYEFKKPTMKNNYTKWGRIAALSLTALLMGTKMDAQLTVQTFSYSGTIGTFTVPPCVTTITMDVRGAQGGYINSGTGGLGARMIGEIAVTPGQVLRYLVGQCPGDAAGAGFSYPGGGGGSYVALGAAIATASPLIVAGGGGAGNGTAGTSAPITTSGTGSAPGTGGNGAPASSCSGGGGGFYTSGGNDIIYGFFGGAGFQQGGAGGGPSATYASGYGYQTGGFGGGTAADYIGSCNITAGNGGGYSGGSGTGTGGTGVGQAGGSFNSGTSQVNTAGANTGHGLISFSYTPGANVLVVASPTAICSGSSATLTASNVSTYTWLPSNTATSSIIVNPTTNTTYTAMGTNSAGCITSAVITLTVSPSLPSLTVAASANTLCLGKSASLTASGALTYTWSNGLTNGIAFTPSVTNAYTVTGGNGCGTVTAVNTITIAPIAVSIVANPTTICSGFTSTLSATAAATSYSWFPTTQTGSTTVVSPTANITYTLAVSDGTCFGTQTLSMVTKITPTITAAISNTRICQGQSVTLSATGAGANATYSWNPSGSTQGTVTLAPNTSTIYNVYGTSSLNCSGTANVFLIVDSAPNLSVTASKTLACSGQNVNLTASGATTYSWTGGPNTAGYTVTASGAGSTYTVMAGQASNTCVATKTISVNAITPAVTASPSISICSGNSATLNASGATSYTWIGFVGNTSGTAAVTPASNTSYTVVAGTTSLNAASQPVTCTISAVSMVVVNSNPTIAVVPTRTATICKNETNTLTANGASSYNWGTAGAGTSIVITPTAAILYTVTGTDANGCTATIFYQSKVSSCQGITENSAAQMINVYPNPNNGEFTISTTSEISLQLVNSLGQHISTITVNPNQTQNVQVNGLSAGIYFLNGENAQGKVNLKLIITK